MTDDRIQKMAREIANQLAKEGKLVEGGWAAFRIMCIPADASNVQVDGMRMAYMAGAQHLFASIMNVMDEGTEPTDEDMRKMDLIHKEMEGYRRELEAKRLGLRT